MRIRIYQINNDLDKDMIKFCDHEFTMKKCGRIFSQIYECVYDGTVQADHFEDVYRIFNVDHPHDFKGHSLSVSDVVEIIGDGGSKFYFCDSCGFKKISFDSSKAGRNGQ